MKYVAIVTTRMGHSIRDHQTIAGTVHGSCPNALGLPAVDDEGYNEMVLSMLCELISCSVL